MDMHTERQAFALWVHVVILACVAPGVLAGVAAPDPGAKWAILIPVSLVLLIYAMFTPMTVRVNSERLRVNFGVIGWPKWDFPIGEILTAAGLRWLGHQGREAGHVLEPARRPRGEDFIRRSQLHHRLGRPRRAGSGFAHGGRRAWFVNGTIRFAGEGACATVKAFSRATVDVAVARIVAQGLRMPS